MISTRPLTLTLAVALIAITLTSCGSTTNSIKRNKPVGSIVNLPGELVNSVLGNVPVVNALKIPKVPLGF